MNSFLSAALAALCVLSLGVSATTLESSVQTDPDDVINLDWDRLPIGEGTAIEMKREMQDNGAALRPDPGGEERAEHQTQPGGGSQGAQRRLTGATRQLSQAVKRMATDASPSAFPWELLWMLVAIGLVAALAAVWYRIAGRFRGAERAAGDDPSTHPWPPDEPATEVDRAWLAMVRRLELDRPWTRTPAECASAAVDTGMDPDAVATVTDAFAEVRYGGCAVTSTHRKRVRTGLQRLDIDPEGAVT